MKAWTVQRSLDVWTIQLGRRIKQARRIGLVAIKCVYFDGTFTDEDKRKLQREARSLSLVSSPHVVSLKTHAMTDSVFCLVMDYLDGESLDKLLHQAGEGKSAMMKLRCLRVAKMC